MNLPIYSEPEPFTKIGHKREPHQPEDIYELVLSEFLKAIDPKTYFVTSGEAVQKAKKLEHDLWLLAGSARKLRVLLEKARGPAVYLETEWIADGKLILKRKNPRPRPIGKKKRD